MLVDAVEGEDKAHDEKQGQQVGGEHGWIRQMNLIRTAWRHEVIDGRNEHHVEQAAAKHASARRDAGRRRFRRLAPLGQRFMTVRTILERFKDFLAAKRTFSSAHLFTGLANQQTAKGTAYEDRLRRGNNPVNEKGALRARKGNGRERLSQTLFQQSLRRRHHDAKLRISRNEHTAGRHCARRNLNRAGLSREP